VAQLMNDDDEVKEKDNLEKDESSFKKIHRVVG
jgi:hypothetical protein